MENQRPNIVLILADNLGWGELGCYGGGLLRGAPTPKIDQLAAQGLRFLNFNVESDCVPTRAALMTGRQAIRTGAFQSIPAGLPQGLTRWETLLPELLKSSGYSTALYGKWHLGDTEDRLPHNRGFDEWYGVPRTLNESWFTSSESYDANVIDIPHIMEGVHGSPAYQVKKLTLESRRTLDREFIERGIQFMNRESKRGNPFFLYLPISQLHLPSLAHPDFMGRTGHGEMADSLAEMDYNVGEIVDTIESLGIADDTVLLFGSDNGPEFRRPWRGTAGYWSSTYHTAMEGSLRAPFMIRWPGKIPAESVTNEVVHVTDIFPTILGICDIKVPTDRPIDGVDQRSFFLGQNTSSNREGFVFFIKEELRAIKWRQWKMHLIWEPEVNEGAIKLEAPYLFNLIQDPKEETNVAIGEGNWVFGVMQRMILEFRKSLKNHPPIPPGTPDTATSVTS